MRPTLNPRFAKWDGHVVVTAVSSEGVRVPIAASQSVVMFHPCCAECKTMLVSEMASLAPLPLEIAHEGERRN